jgi:hypothetical protein
MPKLMGIPTDKDELSVSIKCKLGDHIMPPTGSAVNPDADCKTTLIPIPCLNVWENAKLERHKAAAEKSNFFIIGLFGLG